MHSLFSVEGQRAIGHSQDFWVEALMESRVNTSPPEHLCGCLGPQIILTRFIYITSFLGHVVFQLLKLLQARVVGKKRLQLWLRGRVTREVSAPGRGDSRKGSCRMQRAGGEGSVTAAGSQVSAGKHCREHPATAPAAVRAFGHCA